MNSNQRIFTKPFSLLTLGHFIQALGFSSMPLLPLYLGELGASRGEIGGIMAAAAIGGLLSRPLVGWALDSWGRKPTLIAGTCVMTAAMVGVVLITQVGWIAYAVRFVFGMAAGALFTGYYAAAADMLPIARRTEGLALFGISGLVPLALNPVLGELGFRALDLRWFFPLLGCFIFASVLCLLRIEEPRAKGARQPFRWRSVGRSLLEPQLFPVWLATIVFAGLVAMYVAFSTVSAQAKGVENPALLWLFYGGGAVMVRLFGARIPDRVGPRNIVAPALSLYVLAFIIASSAQSLSGVLFSGLLAGLGHGYSFPVIASQVVGRASPAIRGSALAMFTALWEVAAVSLTPVFGAISDLYGDAFMFALAALCGVVGLALWCGSEHWWGPAPAAEQAR